MIAELLLLGIGCASMIVARCLFVILTSSEEQDFKDWIETGGEEPKRFPGEE